MRQVRTIRYREIAAELAAGIRRRLDDGDLAPGRLLPSEAELSAAYKASRVTIRKALEELRKEGLVDSRQGFGWFVAGEAVRQPLGGLVTIEAQLEAEGRRSERRILDFAFTRAPAAVRAALGVDQTLTVRRVNLADGEPFARVTVWCPEQLGAHLSRSQLAERSFYELLPVTFGGATQTIGADAAGPADAEVLHVPAGSPVLVCTRITRDRAGDPVLYAEYVFPAHRTEFTVDLAAVDLATAEGSLAPRGIRLVE
jgi:GntR family transcriptional regulator